MDPYSEEDWPHREEKWAVDLLKEVINVYFPADKPMEYKLFLPERVARESERRIHLIGLANPDKTNATWKEFVVYRGGGGGGGEEEGIVHVYNLLTHGRKMFRSMVFSTSSSLCLASLARDDSNKALPDVVRNAVGDMKEYRKPSASLQIVRQSKLEGGSEGGSLEGEKVEESGGGSSHIDHHRETLLPSRLLNGVLPSCLLENFRFW